MEDLTIWQRIQANGARNLGVPVALLCILALVTLPMPAFVLDVSFTFNIALSIIILLVAVYALRPLDFGVFPTILLFATLLRLALNVASTRVVLLEGHTGGDAAGKVIEAFGDVVIGGNYVVGIIVFLILVIINFVVVTKGAGRISEVSARFTLDALPGKQMAIDADLNSGLIDQDQARARRKEVESEADFYGAMDGASKFVKGDAIAGILILIINLLGGLGVGMLQHGLDFSTAVEYYSLLTIGDGLVAQIPSLLLSTAAAIMVTRSSKDEEIGSQIRGQMFSSSRALYIAGGVLIFMGMVPGMPFMVFTLLGSGAVALGWVMARFAAKEAAEKAELQALAEAESDSADDLGEVDWKDILTLDKLGLEVGFRLIPLVDADNGGTLLKRVKGIRKKVSQDLGFLVPSIHVRDNQELDARTYQITMMGVTLGQGEVFPEKELAINPGHVFGEIPGTKVQEPSFGLNAVWIEKNLKEKAQAMGYTVADPATVIATHVNDVLRRNADELLGHELVQELLDRLSETSPKLVEEVIPKKLSASVLLKVLKNLLSEGVPITDFQGIVESVAEVSDRTQDPEQLTSAVRLQMSKLIVQSIAGSEENIPVITLDPQVEKMVSGALQANGNGEEGLMLEPSLADQLQTSLDEAAETQEKMDRPSILLVAPHIRTLMAKFVRFGRRHINVLSYNEIPESKRIVITTTVGGA